MNHDQTPDLPDGRDLLRTMGWTPSSDAKPWMDGNKVMSASTLTEDEEREEVLGHLRRLLDRRYGETVGNRAVDELIRRIQEDQ